MGVRTTVERTRIITKIQTKQIQLDALNATFEEACETDVETYRFDSNEGSQQTRRRELDKMLNVIEALESQIERLFRRLACKGLTNLNLRRKNGLSGAPYYST